MEHSGIYVYNAYIHEYMYDPVSRPRDPPPRMGWVPQEYPSTSYFAGIL